MHGTTYCLRSNVVVLVLGYLSVECLLRLVLYCRITIFPNFSLLGVSVSKTSEERTCFFPFLIFPFHIYFLF